MTRANFTPEDDAWMLAQRALGTPDAEIARVLGFRRCTIFMHFKTLDERAAKASGDHARNFVKQGGLGERKRRNCIRCGKEFMSAHSMNRMCPSCRTASTSVSPFDPDFT